MWHRILVLIFVAGCHAGVGPTIAFSEQGVRLGADGSVGGGPLVASAGFTAPLGSDHARGYVTFDPAVMQRLDNHVEGPGYAGAIGGTIGAAWGGDVDGVGGAYGFFTGPVVYAREGYAMPAFSVMVGVRMLAGVREFFVLPKATVIWGVPD